MLQHTPNHKTGELSSQQVIKGMGSTNLEVTPDHKLKQGSNAKTVISTLMNFISAKETGTNQKSGDKKLEKTEESIHRLASQAKRFHAQSHNTPVTPSYLDEIKSRPHNDESDPNTSVKRVETLEQQSKKIDGMLERLSSHPTSNRLEQVQQAGASLRQRVSTSYLNPDYFSHLPKSWFENDSTNASEANNGDQNRVLTKFRTSSHHFDEELAADQPQTKTIQPEQTASGINFTPLKSVTSAQGSVDLSAYSIERLHELQKKMSEAEKAREESIRQANEAMLRLHQAESIISEKEKLIKNQELYLEQIRNDKDEAENSKLKHVSLAQKLQEEQESLANLLKLKESYLASLKEQLDKSEMQRMRTLAQLQEIRGKLRIYCRLKPVPEQEERAVVIKDKDFKEVVFNFDQSKKAKPQLYFFDHVFAEQANQVDVYGEIDPFVQGTLDGNSVCIIAYGPTGSGKTHTLEGSNPDRDTVCEFSGILPRSMAAIIQHIQRKNGLEENPQECLEMYLACLELYNDRLGDLLAKVPKSLKDPNEDEVAISTDKQGKVVLQGLTRVKVRSMQEALDIIRQSNERRQTESTAFNSKSSRSHTIYRITISKVKSPEVALGLLNIVDLAGSEKNSMAQDSAQQASASASRDTSLGPTQGNSSKRGGFAIQQKQQALHQEKLKKIQNEANHINKSLTSLGRILRLIREQRNSGIRDRAIPYRESKLTRLLQDCIGGDAQTLLIINLNPAVRHSGQTKEALLFSSSASV